VHDADSQGLTLLQTLNQLCQYEETFPEILNWEREIHAGIVRGDIANVVTGLWKVNHTSAADTLFFVLTEYNPDAANKLLESIQLNPDDYYILENEFNALGYRLLRMEKKAEALAMFRIMVSFYSESANAYDSLGEAYLALDDHDNAILNYSKSLELDPENQNAREVLKRLKGEGGDIH
jgi:tetratricopeptide (TPR) repeat protein